MLREPNGHIVPQLRWWIRIVVHLCCVRKHLVRAVGSGRRQFCPKLYSSAPRFEGGQQKALLTKGKVASPV